MFGRVTTDGITSRVSQLVLRPHTFEDEKILGMLLGAILAREAHFEFTYINKDRQQFYGVFTLCNGNEENGETAAGGVSDG